MVSSHSSQPPTPRSPAVSEAASTLLERLPVYYQENPGALEELLLVAEDLMAETRGGLARSGNGGGAQEWKRLFGRAGAALGVSSWQTASDELARAAGTGLGIERWLGRGESGAPPPMAIWHGVSARAEDGGLVEFRYSAGPAATLVWGDELPDPPSGFAIPDAILPASVPIQAVRIAKVKSVGRPPDRARIPGIVFWDRGRPDGIQDLRVE
jgi:hypothetical protein